MSNPVELIPIAGHIGDDNYAGIMLSDGKLIFCMAGIHVFKNAEQFKELKNGTIEIFDVKDIYNMLNFITEDDSK